MKKLLLLLILTIVTYSCVSDDFASRKTDIKKIDPFITKISPIKEGFKTIIKVGEEIICETNIEMPYLLEKGKIETIEYTPITKTGYQNSGYAIHQFMAMFEDTRNGDNDYNDFVCYITVMDNMHWEWSNELGRNIIKDELSVYVQPLALGGMKSFKFGIKFPNNETWIATPNSVREDFFDARQGYINVEFENWPIPDKYFRGGNVNHIKMHTTQPYEVSSGNYFQQKINPFIVLEEGDTIYLAIYNHLLEENNYNDIINSKGFPYGIALPKTAWPIEKINISTGYLNFNAWIFGQENTLNLSNRDASKLVNESIIQSEILGQPQSLFNKKRIK